MREYLHKVRPVEVVKLQPGEYEDDRPFIDNRGYQGGMFTPPHPLTPHNDVDVKLSNGDTHYCRSAGTFTWRSCESNPSVISYRRSDTRGRQDILRSQIKEYYGK